MKNLHFSAKLFTRRLVLLALLGTSWAAQAQTRVLINPGDQGEQSRFAVYNVWKGAVEQALRKAAPGSTPAAVLSTDATADLQTTRSRIHEVYVAPAHVVGSAVRYGYVPVLGLDRSVQAVLVAPAEGAITSLAQAQGKRLGLPMQDSVVTYLLRGEINALNTTIKRHFGPLFQTRYQDALLPCLQLRRCDVVAVERAVFDRWVAAGEKLRVIMETRSAPGLSVAVREDSKVNADAFRAALIESLVAGAVLNDGSNAVALKGDDFNYVSTLGYFTPRSLGGAQVVDAAAVAQMLQRGAHYIDTRTDAEFKAGHVPGAQLVPYVEKSAKDADYEATLDQFDTAQLGTDRGVELIFACNGAECWKSYKASQAALKAGFTKVHWFRGGFPEWRAAGQKIATGG
ncbi:MAG: rhodanese-like domain-containing protein [Hydrogenophaga sp.]|nr:rhodanese-like domain-containing protein [Hydrogenophaga sp.]